METKRQTTKRLIEEHKCVLHLRRHAENRLLATFTYDWDADTSCKFTLLSEVAESLQDAFAYLIRKRGLEQCGTRFTNDKPFAQDLLVPTDASPAGRRWLALVPGGIPRWVRCYDNGGVDAGGSIDQYTAVFTGQAAAMKMPGVAHQWPYLAMNSAPYHPQGFGQHGQSNHQPCDVNKHGWAPAVGRKNHLGKRIEFLDLPPDCQRLVFDDYLAIWNL
jgi:hypothetical protein